MIDLGILGISGMTGRSALLHQDFLDRNGVNYTRSFRVYGNSTRGRKLGEVFDEKENALTTAYPFWKREKCPEQYRDLVIEPIDLDKITDQVQHVISCLPTAAAQVIEPALRERGINVFSCASASRWEQNVFLGISEVNPQDVTRTELQLLSGKQCNKPNCSDTVYVPVLHEIIKRFGLKKIDSIYVHTEQGLSGKGDEILNPKYLLRVSNAIRSGCTFSDWARSEEDPLLNEEEWKTIHEPLLILGLVKTKEEAINEMRLAKSGKQSKAIKIYAETHRVPEQNGHLEHISITCKGEIRVEDIRRTLEEAAIPIEIKGLPSTPEKLFYLVNGMPKRSKHLVLGDGSSTIAGAFKQVSPNAVRFSLLGDNIRKGASWGARQLLEIFLRQYKGMFPLPK